MAAAKKTAKAAPKKAATKRTVAKKAPARKTAKKKAVARKTRKAATRLTPQEKLAALKSSVAAKTESDGKKALAKFTQKWVKARTRADAKKIAAAEKKAAAKAKAAAQKAAAGAKAAAKVVSQIEPRIVIPMHYLLAGLKFKLHKVDEFLKEMGVKNAEAQNKFTVKVRDFSSEETKVVLLTP